MSRCKICDYSPDTPSDFHRGLSLGAEKPRLVYQKITKDYTCSVCLWEPFDHKIEDGEIEVLETDVE